MNPMVDEVNKIVYNLLASEHAVHIPSVGSLLVERIPAKHLSKRRVVPPYFAVIFTSHAIGRTLTDAVAEAAGCDAVAAQEVVERWLSRAMQTETLTIEGVGVLRQKSFSVDPAFDRAINRHDRTPVAVRPAESHWLFWTAATIAIVCGIGACGWILYDRMAQERLIEPQYRTEIIAAVEPAPVVAADSSAAINPDTAILNPGSEVQLGDHAPQSASSQTQLAGSQSAEQSAVQPHSATRAQPGTQRPAAQSQSGTQPEAHAASLEVQPMTPGRYYVVLGVFSTEANAQRAAREAMSADATLRCGVWKFGAKYLASLFVSDDAAACADFIKAHSDRYPEAWSYRAK